MPLFVRRYLRHMIVGSRSSFATFLSSTFALIVGGVAVLAACASDPAPATTCDSAKCAPGNTCLTLDGELKCRKTCSSNADPATSCPFGYTCTDTETGQPPFCIQNTAVGADGQPLKKKPSGQWGSKCQADLGIENPGCDGEQGFYCYGESPTDADAYCTRYDCETDRDCGAGFWCAKVNRTPNAKTAKRKGFGDVQNVCLRRSYCSTCKVDLDCPPIRGKTQHCVQDADGASFCAPECDGSASCPLEARCADVGVGAKVCYPRAQRCVGDGSLCSPCRADSDCAEGSVCTKGQYTTEKACTKKVASCAECPKTLESPARNIGCTREDGDELPKNHCVGLYELGKPAGVGEPQPYDIGCWTPNR